MLLVSEPSLGNAEKVALAETVDSNWIAMGDRVRALEQAFARVHDAADAVAVSCCTAGLHLALAALGIGPGDEVLVPSLSFVATANCVLYVGAIPVFVDIAGLDDPLMSVEQAARACTARTKAIILMHYAGHVADRAIWTRFAGSQGLALVEDAAHAAGAAGAGIIGDVGVFSFYSNKNMTTAEGGMVFARDPAVLDRIRLMRGHGMSSGTRQRLDARTPTYDVTVLGWNYRMDDLRAAIGLVQLAALPARNARRAELTHAYRDALAERCPAVSIPFSNACGASAHHFLPAVLPASADRAAVMGKLRDAGIQTTIHYPPIHHLSLYRERFPDISLPATEAFSRRELTLPLHPKMQDAEVTMVADALTSALSL
jgi:dTDP-4-amino-4,6-dideoxygalactose transaminase